MQQHQQLRERPQQHMTRGGPMGKGREFSPMRDHMRHRFMHRMMQNPELRQKMAQRLRERADRLDGGSKFDARRFGGPDPQGEFGGARRGPAPEGMQRIGPERSGPRELPGRMGRGFGPQQPIGPGGFGPGEFGPSLEGRRGSGSPQFEQSPPQQRGLRQQQGPPRQQAPDLEGMRPQGQPPLRQRGFRPPPGI